MVTSEQLSVAVAVPVMEESVLPTIEEIWSRQLWLNRSPTPGIHSTDVLAGQVIVGAMLSSTVMVCWQSVLLPQASVAVHVRVITSGQAPLLLSEKLITGSGSQTSAALALPVFAGLVAYTEATRLGIQLPLAELAISPVHCTVALAGQEIDGVALSTTETS